MPSSERTPSDIHPALSYDDAAAAIEWLCKAFGFRRGYMVEDIEGHQWYFGNYRPGAYWEG